MAINGDVLAVAQALAEGAASEKQKATAAECTKKGDYYFENGVMKIWNGNDFTTIGTDVAAQWGLISGTLTAQTDLKNAMDKKADLGSNGKVVLSQLPDFVVAQVITVQTYADLPATGDSGYVYDVVNDPDTTKNGSYKWVGNAYFKYTNEQNYYNVAVSSEGYTMGQLKTVVDSINIAGQHVFFDLHALITDAYVCIVHFDNALHCVISDLLNNKIYGVGKTYSQNQTVANYVGNDYVDLTSPKWGAISGALSNQTDLLNALNAKADTTALTAHTGNTNNPHGVTKNQVGLGNVDNTADINKPVSTLQQAEIDKRLNKFQGVANKDKAVVVGSDGYLTLVNASKQIVYGFHINKNDSNPETCVTYLEDAVGMTPAYMDYTNDVFNYGSWRNAFFMPKPCMVKSDGTVDYYLDPNDYSKKVDGTASDISDYTYDGNAMMEWGDGVNIVWMKIVADAGDTNSGSVYIANYQADSDYTCYPFINKNGVRKNHFYTPIYNGSLDTNNKLRSISGKPVIQGKTAIQERTYAQANGTAWDTEFWCDIQLIDNLLILIGKSINTQAVFGLGNQSGYDTSKPQNNILATGTMDTKGMFWGKNVSSQADNSGVKVFGMENYWANQFRRFVGLIMDAGTVKAKLTYGTQDGSTATDYNTDGTGYLVIGSLAGVSGGYLKEQTFHSTGLYPAVTGGSATTYYSDYYYLNTASAGRYALRGGYCYSGAACGAFYVDLNDGDANTHWYFGAGVSLKPLN